MTMYDLFDVQKELIQVSAKWMSIGIALRLKPNILDGIETRYGLELSLEPDSHKAGNSMRINLECDL